MDGDAGLCYMWQMKDMHDPTGIRRSRRNLIKVVATTSSAILASAKVAHAGPYWGGDSQGSYWGGNGQGANGAGGGASCFLRGTMIRTAHGDRKIEDLTIGDLLPTVFGGARPILWIGRYLFRKSDPTRAWVKDVLPVRVARSALGPDVPYADLFVTRAHSLLIDDMLVPVGNLINDTTIAVYDDCAVDELEFFHIKFEAHDVIYAEGTPCETLLDVDEKAINFAEYLRQYGTPPSPNTPCAPVFGYGRRTEIKSRLRSAISPWFDCRQELDIIRDKLEEGEPLLRHSELIS
jgi:Hint domain